MQITKKNLSDTQIELTIAADAELLAETKQRVLEQLAKNVSLSGFRKGKAPLHLVEKSVDQNVLTREFLDEAMNKLYVEAVTREHIRPVAQPEVSIQKFVPFTTLELQVKVEAVGDIKLPDYKKIKLAKKPVAVTDKDIDGVLDNLRNREAKKTEVKRAAQNGDQITIDFKGADAKTKEPISGGEGKDYPLILGSDTFIPGFEAALIGLKAGEHEAFDLTVPKDYGVAALKNKKVTFDVTVKNVQEVAQPKLDNAFAAKVGPFKTVAELKADVKRQLGAEQQNQADRAFENELLKKIADKTTVAIPKPLIEEEIDRMELEEKQNVMYRGQTWQEHLDSEGVTEAEHRERQREQAELRVKGGLVLAEIADAEKITVTPEELEMRLRVLKGQYSNDKQMQAELDKPENRRDILNRMVSEKTIAKLTGYATA